MQDHDCSQGSAPGAAGDATLVADSQPDEHQPGGLHHPQLQPLHFTDEQAKVFTQQPSIAQPTGHVVHQLLCSLPGMSFVRKFCSSADASQWMQSMLDVWKDKQG